MSKPQLYIPAVAGEDTASLIRWARHAAGTMNEFMRRMATGAFFVWDEGCKNVPTNTNIDGAEELIFESPFTGNGTLIVTGVGFEGDVHVALNGTDLGTLSDPDTSSEILYEVAVTNLIDGLNSFKIWSTSADTGELRRLEAWRNFTKEQLSSAGTTADWGSVTGTGKPDDNADVTSDNPQPWGWVTDDGNRPEDLADVTTAHAAEVIFESSSLPASPQAGWLVYLTSADGGFSADTWVRRNDANTAWIKVGAHDALELINGPNESGADQTALHAINGVDNPNFEAGDTGWSKGPGWSIVQDATNARDGSWVAELSGGSDGNLSSETRLQVEPGDRVLVHIFAKIVGGSGDLRANIRWNDSSGSNFGTDFGAARTPGSSYEQLRNVGIAPAGAVTAWLDLGVDGGGGTLDAFADGAFVAIIPQDADIDALQTTNGPVESGSDQTIPRIGWAQVINGGFESGANLTLIPGWIEGNGFAGLVQTHAMTGSYSLAHDLSIASGGSAAAFSRIGDAVLVSANEIFLVRAWVQRDEADVPDADAQLQITWRDSGKNALLSETVGTASASSSGWQVILGQVTAPALGDTQPPGPPAVATIGLGDVGGGTTGKWYWDDVSVHLIGVST